MPILLATAVVMSTAMGAFAQRVSGLGFALLGGTIAAALAGLACAHLFAHRVDAARARRAAIAIAALATAATVIHGIIVLGVPAGGRTYG